MLKQYYGSVKVTWLDRAQVIKSVKDAVHGLVRRHPEIVKVVLFGSLARGEAVPGSDADLLVILSEDGRTFRERMPDYMIATKEVGVDVFPYTVAELTKMEADGNRFIKSALAEGVIIYSKRKAPGP
ncbi:MAG: nucleotidyltransferase domain-containing protein [Chloroflexi bacterium]|nr:nucleotidyltransferase domain-containing protein [Chloroflexota bacterium]